MNFQVTKDGKPIYGPAPHDRCFMYIQDAQSQSLSHAIRHEGWSIVPLLDDKSPIVDQIGDWMEALTHLFRPGQSTQDGSVENFIKATIQQLSPTGAAMFGFYVCLHLNEDADNLERIGQLFRKLAEGGE